MVLAGKVGDEDYGRDVRRGGRRPWGCWGEGGGLEAACGIFWKHAGRWEGGGKGEDGSRLSVDDPIPFHVGNGVGVVCVEDSHDSDEARGGRGYNMDQTDEHANNTGDFLIKGKGFGYSIVFFFFFFSSG